MGFLQREVFLGQHLLGCPVCQKESWSPGSVVAKQGQGCVLGSLMHTGVLGSPQMPKAVSCTVSSQILEESDNPECLRHLPGMYNSVNF